MPKSNPNKTWEAGEFLTKYPELEELLSCVWYDGLHDSKGGNVDLTTDEAGLILEDFISQLLLDQREEIVEEIKKEIMDIEIEECLGKSNMSEPKLAGFMKALNHILSFLSKEGVKG